MVDSERARASSLGMVFGHYGRFDVLDGTVVHSKGFGMYTCLLTYLMA
jgi:hypothetical protein